MKDAFYLILKTLIVLKIFECLPWLFVYVEKKGVIRKIRLFSKFTTSQSTITIYILSDISWSKGKQTMKFGQVIDHNKKSTVGRTAPYLVLLFDKVLYKVKANGLSVSNILIVLNLACNINKLYKT